MKRSFAILTTSALIVSSSLIAQGSIASASTNAITSTSAPVITATIVNGVNMRNQPSLSGKVIGFVSKNTQVTIVDQSNSYFYLVRTSTGEVGYVSSSEKYMIVNPIVNPAPTPTFNGEIVYGVNIRTEPSSSSSVITMLSRGTKVIVIEKSNDYYYKVTTEDGIQGYISSNSKYVQVEGPIPDAAPPAPAPAPAPTFNGEIVYGVNIRTEPSTSSSVITMLSRGTKLIVIEKTNDYYYKVTTEDGIAGYISTNSKYVQVDGHIPDAAPPAPAPAPAPTINGEIVYGVNIRTEPSSSSAVITMLSRGTKLTVLEKSTDYFYKVVTEDGITGYVSTSSKYIQVDGVVPEASSPSPTPSLPGTPQAPGVSGQIESVINTGMKYLGTPYEFGSDRKTTATFDCSDFVKQAFNEALNITLPSDSRKQGSWIKDNSTAIYNINELKRGDLLFFMSYKGSSASNYEGIDKDNERITHVAIYLGNGQILHTYSVKSGGVRVDSLNKSWTNRFLFGGSVVK